MELLGVFPHLNALLNGLSSVFLLFGFSFILRRDVVRHRACMLTACVVSSLFLASYLTYHSLRTYYFGLGPTTFTGTGLARPIYLTILSSHTILAAAVAPFVVLTLWRALKTNFDSHRKIARLVYPVWLYVSVTGVMVYLMLYQLYPAN